jgi:hypothetical protein
MGMNDPTDPAQPTDPDQPDGDQDPDEIERQNAELREQLRAERAERLASENGLPRSYVELLANTPRDQQEAKAVEYAQELRAHVGAPVAGPGGQPGGSSLPAPPGSEPPAEPASEPTDEDRLVEEVGQAQNLGGLMESQLQAGRRAREPAPLEEPAVGADVEGIRKAESLDDLLKLQQSRKAAPAG